LISAGTPKAKAVSWGDPDAEGRKRGDRTGFKEIGSPVPPLEFLILGGTEKKSGCMLENLVYLGLLYVKMK